MLFLTNVYHVSWGNTDVLELDGETIKATPAIQRQCKLISRIHSIMVGVGTVVGYMISVLLSTSSFFEMLLIIAAVLAILTLIFNLLSKYLIRKRLKK